MKNNNITLDDILNIFGNQQIIIEVDNEQASSEIFLLYLQQQALANLFKHCPGDAENITNIMNKYIEVYSDYFIRIYNILAAKLDDSILNYLYNHYWDFDIAIDCDVSSIYIRKYYPKKEGV